MTLTVREVRMAILSSHRPLRKWITWICLGLALALTAPPARADEDEDRYLHIVEVIQQADALNTKGKTAAALAKYQEAQAALRSFRQTYTDWNPRAVAYRQKYVADKIQACTEQTAAITNNAAALTPSQSPAQALTGSVKLISAGSDPRNALRLHPKTGDKQSLALQIKMTTSTKLGDMATPAVKLPLMAINLEVTVQSVSEQGDIGYSAVVTEATVAEDAETAQLSAAMKPALAGLKGLTTTGALTSRGSNKGVNIQSPGGANPQLKQATDLLTQSFGAFSLPLPEEPVGVGAQWEVKEPVKAQGITYDQTTTYQLVSEDGDQLSLKATISQSAANQQIQSPAMPGLKMDLTKMTGRGTGEITADLGRILPQQAALSSHSELTMGMNAGGQKQTMSMNIDVEMQIQPK